MKKPTNRKHADTVAEGAARGQWPVPSEDVPSEEEVAQMVADMDDPSKWIEDDAMLGPGFYRAPGVARQLAEAVAAYRAERGLSQRQLARAIALDEHWVAYIESGKHTPELETLVRLARHLGLSFTVHVSPAGAELSADTAPNAAGAITHHEAHEHARPATGAAPVSELA
jgi:transcriptional regulator with XRE-family HTH domain